MTATHRVVDSDGSTVGFMVNQEFHTDYDIRENIEYVDNLTMSGNEIISEQNVLPVISYRQAVIENEYQRIAEENPFVRDIQKELEAWRQDQSHKVLQLEGSRQIGKTTELLKFAYGNYEYVIYVNIVNDKYRFQECINSGVNAMEMEKYCRRAKLPHYIDNKNTILIIDEIQDSSSVYNSIREMDAKLHCDIVVTGSYLGRILENKSFFLPAGTISYAYMFTMSFAEFCRVFRCDDLLYHIDLYGNDQEEDYAKLDALYQIYIKIGGYPEVVKKYRQTQNIDACYEIIDKLLNTFQGESRNYFTDAREVEIFGQVYREALKEMCNEKKGSGKSTVETLTSLVKSGTSMIVNKNEVVNAIIWLRYAGILGMCNLAYDGDMRNILPDCRMYFADCGVASYVAGNSLIDQSSLAGIITETFVYNELHRLFKKPYSERKVIEDEVCFSILGENELDFMIADKNKVIYGIEVKTNSGEPKSLKVFIRKGLVDKGIVAKHSKGGRGTQFDTIPVYTVGCRFPYDI